MLDHGTLSHGEVDMREFMIGILAVGIFAGVLLGRNTERARRSYRNQVSGKTTYQNYRKTALADARKAAGTVVLFALIMIALLLGVMSLTSR
jgi:hypothetical protein